MAAVFDWDTHTISVMAGTQIVKTELQINVAAYYICRDPSPILFVQPTQGAAAAFSKERFAPTIEVTPALRQVVRPPKSRDSETTITHKSYPGGSLDFVGANSPTDLASRPKRIILSDEIDKYPPSAGSEGDPLKLAEERASTYKALGRAKFVRTCSPTVEGFSRIGREYAASDQRKCYVACIHCGHEQTLRWENVHWDKDEHGGHLPHTAALQCEECGAVWTEKDRVAALDNLAKARGYGWRQTKDLHCCGQTQTPARWDDRGRSLCSHCGQPSSYSGHAGFHINKLYSKRHRLPEIVKEFLESKGDPELIRKFTNTALAELWSPKQDAVFDSHKLMARAEAYGSDDLPPEIKVVTGFCDVQIDRLEVQFIGWGRDEECWPFQYTIINLDPAQPQAWKELDVLLASKFRVRDSERIMRCAAFGVDMGGAHTAQVLSWCTQRRGRRIFACKGVAGARPIWSGHASQAATKQPFWLIGVDTAKDAIYGRLAIDPPEPGYRRPGFIHFPVAENFGVEYFDQLNSERKERFLRMGIAYVRWVPIRQRNEALDTFVGALAVRRSLPRVIEAALGYTTQAGENAPAAVPAPPGGIVGEGELLEQALAIPDGRIDPNDPEIHQAYIQHMRPAQPGNWVRPRGGRPWLKRE
jgi:phage terminase large subunit GpA-like protein